MIPNMVRLVAAAREKGVPVFWVRVERRPDRSDVVDNLIDAPAYAWHVPNPPVVAGSYSAANVDELLVQSVDQVIIKPRLNPFTYTDLDLQLRARHVSTILLGGYSTNLGVESCARTGHDLGYNVVVISDCYLQGLEGDLDAAHASAEPCTGSNIEAYRCSGWRERRGS